MIAELLVSFPVIYPHNTTHHMSSIFTVFSTNACCSRGFWLRPSSNLGHTNEYSGPADEHSIPSAEHEAQAEVPSREDPETDAQTQHISRSRARKDVKKAAKARKAANWEANQQKVAKGRKMKVYAPACLCLPSH